MSILTATTLTHVSNPQSPTTVARLRMHLPYVLTALGAMSGTVAIVWPFALGTSPLDAWHFELYRPLVPAFLTPPAVAAVSVRWLTARSLRRVERHFTGVVAAASGFSTLVFFSRGILEGWPLTIQEWASLLVPCFVLAAAIWFCATSSVSRDLKAVNALQAAYAANAAYCLIAFAGQWQVGAWFALATVTIYGLQTIASLLPFTRSVPEQRAASTV